MKIMVLGGSGQLGRDIGKVANSHGVEARLLSHADTDVTDTVSLAHAVDQHRPDVIVNTAAMHQLDDCEIQIEKAFLVNGIGALNVAKVAAERDVPLFHISTDYVFDGLKTAPYVETDQPLPVNVYGNTKLAGEYFVRTTARKHFVLRVSGLFGVHPCRAKQGRNFVTTMLQLASERESVSVVTDEIMTPTHTLDVARQVMALSESEAYGLYHATSEGSCSWFDFAKQIFEIKGVTLPLKAITSDEFQSKHARPRYSVLENDALKTLGLNVMPHWQDALAEYLGIRG